MNSFKEIRLKKGLKQIDIARATGLSKATISLYENGKSKPSINSAYKVANELEVTIDELFLFEFEQQQEV